MDRPEIDLEGLGFEELFELHDAVVKRLRYLGDLRARASLDRFQPGDRVRFDDGNGREVAGTVVRVNRKTLTVDTRKGRWSGVPPFAVSEHLAQVKPSKVLDQLLGKRRKHA